MADNGKQKRRRSKKKNKKRTPQLENSAQNVKKVVPTEEVVPDATQPTGAATGSIDLKEDEPKETEPFLIEPNATEPKETELNGTTAIGTEQNTAERNTSETNAAKLDQIHQDEIVVEIQLTDCQDQRDNDPESLADVSALELSPIKNDLETDKYDDGLAEVSEQVAQFSQEHVSCETPSVVEKERDPANDIDLQNIKKDLYEKSDGTLTINLYVRNAVKETMSASIRENELRIHFQTGDEKILNGHANADKFTFFTWGVKLKEAVVTNHCVLNTTRSTILITLRKVDPFKKWDSIEATANSSKVNRVVPHMWVPVVVPSVELPRTAADTQQTSKIAMDNCEPLSECSANDGFKSPLLKKPTCLVNPMKDDAPHVVAPGMTGLANLGNTCFMNSVLQCLVNTREFRDYFRDDVCSRDINTENPLGTGGKLATRFTNLCNALWDGQHRVFEPSQLKNFIAIKASQFSGFAQHDAHEFMAFLLDGLHEDLNRIVNRPYVEAKDWDGRSDEVVANESWDMYRQRNDSIVVDLFQGQYKSKLLCPVCGKVSITFDPFLYLAIPLPKKIRVMPIIFFGKDPSQPPVKFRVKLTQDSTVEDVKEQIHKAFKVLPINLRVFEVYKNRVHRFLVKGQESNISLNDTIFVFEVLSYLSVGEPVNEITVIQRLIMPLRSTRCSFCLKDSPSLENSLKRCTKCFKASYCDQSCQKNHWSTHKANCKYSLDLVGLPFIVSLPQSKTTLAKLSEVMEAYARYSVDVFQPPVPLPDSSSLQTVRRTNSNGGEPDPSLDLESPMECVTPSSPDEPPSFDLTPLKNQVLQSPVDDVNMEDSSSGLVSGEATASSRISTAFDSASASAPHEGVGAKVQVVYGRQRNESKTERPFAMFGIRRVNQSGVTLSGADGKALEDNGDQPLDLAPETFLAMDWRNNEKQENYVLVQSKELEAEFSQLNCDSKLENNFKLDQCLRLFTESEKLSPQEAWYCSKCKKHREATKEMSIWKLPTILIVQLKRFSFKNMIWRDKIDKMVEYPIRGLDMSEFYCGLKDGDTPPIYDLYATINHHGNILGGHYTACARLLDNVPDNRSHIDWRLFDDSDVRATPESSVMARSAYVLFYRRRGVIFAPTRSLERPANVTSATAAETLDSDDSSNSDTIPVSQFTRKQIRSRGLWPGDDQLTTSNLMKHPLEPSIND